jgi:peroxiredoxin
VALTFLCAFAAAKVGQPAPRFSARTLEGVTYNNASLGGSVTLLQFWTTAPRCRADEAALDEIDSKFGAKGLIVLAIDEGESAATVKKYLREHPRTVRIVLDEHRQIARRFGKHGCPYYVLIDREGRIAGTQRGPAGEQALVSLLRRAGFAERQAPQARGRTPQQSANQDVGQDVGQGVSQGASQNQPGEGKQAGEGTQAGEGKQPGEQAAEAPPKPPSGMKVIEIPPDKNSHPGQPLPKAVFVLTSGERLESDRYTMDTHFLHIAIEGEERVIAINKVDVRATEAANRARGIEIKVPTSKSEVFVSF